MSRFESTRWSLVRRAADGDEEALREVLDWARPPVVAYLRRRGLAAEAEDLAQEVFLLVHRDRLLARADPERGRLRSLLWAVTRHVIGHHIERSHAAKRGPRKMAPLDVAEIARDEPEDAFDREWVAHLIRGALSHLERSRPAYHAAIRMFLLEGRTQAEVAEALGTTAANVRNLVHRGKRALVRHIQDQVMEYAASRHDYEAEIRSLSRLFPG